MKRQKKSTKVIIFTIIISLLIISSITVLIISFSQTGNEAESEHVVHLRDISVSIDRNINTIINDEKKILSHLVASSQPYEDIFISDGNIGGISDVIDKYPLDTFEETEFFVIYENKIVYNVGSNEEFDYDFTYGFSTDYPCILRSKSGNNHIVLINKSNNNDIYYAIGMEMSSFFYNTTSVALNEEYWMVFYSEDLGIFFQNHKNQPEIRTITPEEAKERNDGVTVLVDSELSGNATTYRYDFLSPHYGSIRDYLLYTFPTSCNANNYFAIGVAVDIGDYVTKLTYLMWSISISGFVLITSFAALIIMFLYSQKKNKEVKEETELLQKKNDSMSEMLEKQKEILHHQRLETIGTMTSGITHKFNNLLTPIMGYSLLAMEKVPPEYSDIIDDLTEVYTASSRAKSLVSRISELSKKNNEHALHEVYPNTLIEKVIETASSSIPDNITVEASLKCTDETIFANETELGQLFLNIVINAVSAMKNQDGILTITTESKDDKVYFTVKDNGTGIPAEILDKIFEPFFTTKGSEGTGLGLSISKEIASRNDGDIFVESEPGVGTVFTVTFKKHVLTPA